MIDLDNVELNDKGFNKKIKINKKQTAKKLLDYGFTNYHEPTLYYSKMIDYDISFNLSVDKKSLEIIGIDILDENFLQPYDYQYFILSGGENYLANKVYSKVNELMSKLQNDGIIIGFKQGMYI